jgi:hypothetical protein
MVLPLMANRTDYDPTLSRQQYSSKDYLL